MSLGLLFCILGAISFGLLGCVSKMAERRQCDSSAVVFWLFCWAAIFALARTITQKPIVHLSWPVVGLAVGLGFCSVIAFVAFQMSIEIGKVTVGWLFMNLSAGVPALVSIALYGEKLTPMKSLAFWLAIIALFCLFQGNRLETREAALESSQ